MPFFASSYDSGITVYAIGIIINVLAVIICPIVAANKGRSVGGWIIGGLLLSLIGIIIVSCLPSLIQQTTYRTTTHVTRSHAPQKYCSHCGQIVITYDNICPNCGYSLNPTKTTSTPSVSQTKYCYKCHKTIFTANQFCPDCGSKLSVTNTNIKTESKMKKCATCGRVVVTTSTVCSSCGGQLKDY